MTILEANAACKANSARIMEVGKFSKAFRQTESEIIQAGESFVVPDDYVVFAQKMGKDSDGNAITAEFINVITNTGRNARFYPSSMVKILFAVDENGKNIQGADRIKRTSGTLAKYCAGKPMDSVMTALKGCTIECTKLTEVKTRRFGVTEDVATAKDVQIQRVGEWNLVGERKPSDWIG